MPPVVLERPKMSRAMWEALKSHILRERQRKKQELEADAEVERQRKERERQLKQDSMTLSETRDQIVALDSRLTSLKEEKHQLFMQLKKVLNEDETRRRQLLSKEASEMMPVHNYMPHPGLPMGSGPPQMMFQPVLARPAMYTVPRVAHAPQHGQPSLLGPRFEGIHHSLKSLLKTIKNIFRLHRMGFRFEDQLIYSIQDFQFSHLRELQVGELLLVIPYELPRILHIKGDHPPPTWVMRDNLVKPDYRTVIHNMDYPLYPPTANRFPTPILSKSRFLGILFPPEFHVTSVPYTFHFFMT
ncbi:unnamed protein product [Allacma fusca]|uniref:Uncharacterized protein n=1 Tax=Allacma fusca TaxID=39272 RepID=A0A8J2PIY3_9HEXA|nr:unnamed protein product [Allacma fusca]